MGGSNRDVMCGGRDAGDSRGTSHDALRGEGVNVVDYKKKPQVKGINLGHKTPIQYRTDKNENTNQKPNTRISLIRCNESTRVIRNR